MVTHSDSDHIDGILKLLQKFPPNLKPEDSPFKFVFHGPLLATKLCEKNEKREELIVKLKEASFVEEVLECNPSNAQFGGDFTFYFRDNSVNRGVIFKRTEKDGEIEPGGSTTDDESEKRKRPKLSSSGSDAVDEEEKSNPHTHTKTNLSSIVTKWGANDKPVVILTGDAPGYRALTAFKQDKVATVDFFQVPHHVSARNSLPLKRTIQTEDIQIVKQMIALYIILHCKVDTLSDRNQTLIDECIGKEVEKLRLKGSFQIFRSEIVKVLEVDADTFFSKHDVYRDLRNKSGEEKAMFVFEEAVAGLETVFKQVEECVEDPVEHKITGVFNFLQKSFFKPEGSRYLYSFLEDKAMKNLLQQYEHNNIAKDVYRECLDLRMIFIKTREPYSSRLMSICVFEFYKQFSANIYYISSSTDYGHPNPATISGIIKAAMVSRNQCTLLFSAGYAIPRPSSLPQYSKWKDVVTLRYLSNPYARVDPQRQTFEFTEVFTPNEYDSDKLKQLEKDLKSGAVAHFFNSDESGRSTGGDFLVHLNRERSAAHQNRSQNTGNEPVVQNTSQNAGNEPVAQNRSQNVRDEPVNRQNARDEPVVQNTSQNAGNEPVVQNRHNARDKAVVQNRHNARDEPVVQNRHNARDEPVVQNTSQNAGNEPVVQNRHNARDEPVVQNRHNARDEPVVQNTSQNAGNEPVVQNRHNARDEPVVQNTSQNAGNKPVVQNRQNARQNAGNEPVVQNRENAKDEPVVQNRSQNAGDGPEFQTTTLNAGIGPEFHSVSQNAGSESEFQNGIRNAGNDSEFQNRTQNAGDVPEFQNGSQNAGDDTAGDEPVHQDRTQITAVLQKGSQNSIEKPLFQSKLQLPVKVPVHQNRSENARDKPVLQERLRSAEPVLQVLQERSQSAGPVLQERFQCVSTEPVTVEQFKLQDNGNEAYQEQSMRLGGETSGAEKEDLHSVALSEFLRLIKFHAEVSDVQLSDMALLLTGSYLEGVTKFNSLPSSLILAIAAWRIDDIRSNVIVDLTASGPVAVGAEIFRAVPIDSHVSFGSFTLAIQELSICYPMPSSVYQILGTGELVHQLSSEQRKIEFAAAPCVANSMPEISFHFGPEESLSEFFSFLQLNPRLKEMRVPFLNSALSDIPISRLGFTLRQGVQDSTTSHSLHLLSFGTQISNWNSFLPCRVAISGESTLQCTFVVLLPASPLPLLGFEMNFSTSVGSADKTFELQCKASILPIETDCSLDESGYTCFLKFSTVSCDRHLGSPKLSDILSALGFGTYLQLSTAIPVLGAIIEHVSLKDMEIAYNTATKALTSLHLQVVVPEWQIIGEIAISNFELELDYSDVSGWEAYLQSELLLSELYFVIISFTLPTVARSGELSFKNQFHDLTVSKMFQLLGLDFPDLDQIPILGSILSIMVKEVTLWFEIEDEALTVYGLKLGFFMDSINLQVFSLKAVEIELTYCRAASGSTISFKASGYIGESMYVEISYDPRKFELSGHVEVANSKALSVDGAKSVLLADGTLSQNTAYDIVAQQPAVAVSVSLVCVKESIKLKSFGIALDNVFEVSFAGLSLSHFSLLYSKEFGPADTPEQQLASELKLETILLQKDGLFGVQFIFDCSISSEGPSTITAEIHSIPGKKVSVRSFLSLTGLNIPQLPESGSASKPSPEGYLDLELERGSVTFETSPVKKLQSLEVTTAFATGGWVILDDPKIVISNVYLTVSYSEKDGVKASLCGTVTIGGVELTLAGSKGKDITTFLLAVYSSSASEDLMGTMNALSPLKRQGLSLPTNAGLPKKLHGSFAAFELVLGPEKRTFKAKACLSLESWNLDLQFASFSVNQLEASLQWEQDRTGSCTSNYSLWVCGTFTLDSIPVKVELNIGSAEDTIVQATINDTANLQLSTFTDKTLGFGSKGASSNYSDLLPQDVSPISFSSRAYLQFNITKKLVLLFGEVKDLGTCLLIAGALKSSDSFGYAVALTIPRLSSLIWPLAAVESTISINNISASVMNLDGLNVDDLSKAIAVVEKSLIPAESSSLPFKNLSVTSSQGKISMSRGLSLYCELSFSGSSNKLLQNLSNIQQGTDLIPSLILSAQYTSDKSVSHCVFRAIIPSLELFGALHFSDIMLSLSCNMSNADTSYALALSGNMEVKQIPDVIFCGSIEVFKDKASFELVGDGQPLSFAAPFDMFGISIERPKLAVNYHFGEGKRDVRSEFLFGGTVNIYSKPPEKDGSKPEPALSLDCKCVWADLSLSLISIELNNEENPLTLSGLFATVFGWSWDTNFIDMGLYDGKMYYANNGITHDNFYFQPGFNISCKTFLIKRSFVILLELSLDKTGFTAKGSAVEPFDFGIAKFSTGEMDSKGDFLNKGPTLAYKHTTWGPDLSLSVGLTFLDYKIVSLTIHYVPLQQAFIFDITYPGSFLGVTKPSISFAWSFLYGFAITSWNLDLPDIAGFVAKVVSTIKDAIVDFFFGETVTPKFSLAMSSASVCSTGMFALNISGTCDMVLGGAGKGVLLKLPEMTVDIPASESVLTFDAVGKYIVDKVVSSAESVVKQQILYNENKANLMTVVSAMPFDQLAGNATAIIASLNDLGLSNQMIAKIGFDTAVGSTSAAVSSPSVLQAAFDWLPSALLQRSVPTAAGSSVTEVPTGSGNAAAGGSVAATGGSVAVVGGSSISATGNIAAALGSVVAAGGSVIAAGASVVAAGVSGSAVVAGLGGIISGNLKTASNELDRHLRKLEGVNTRHSDKQLNTLK